MFSFTALLGAQSASSASQSLLELDGGVRILVDIGWDEAFNVEALRALEQQVSSLSFILLTHPTLEHLGAFAHFCKHVPQFKSIPVYATSPVIALGRTLLQDLYNSSLEAATVVPQEALAEASYAVGSQTGQISILRQPPTQEEIAGYFSLINSLRYSQPTQPIASTFSPSVDGLSITAYAAGHTLGGTMWHIQFGTDSIVYAVDWNQAKENILGGAAWLGSAGGGAEILEPLRRPTAMICSSKGIERPHIGGGRRKRDEALLELVNETIYKQGVVLIPTDSSARVLELAFILEQHWRKQLARGNEAYKNTKVHLASKTAGSTVRLARSMMEWMDDGMIREWEATNDAQKAQKGGGNEDRPDQTPFDFRHVKLVESRSRLQKLLANPRPGVILASDSSMRWGFSSDALQALSSGPSNLVVLTEYRDMHDDVSSPSPSPYTSLYRSWHSYIDESSNKQTRSARIKGQSIVIRQPQAQELANEELSVYQQYLARRRQMQSAQGDSLPSSMNPTDAIVDDHASSSSESSDASDDDQQGQTLTLSNAMNQSRRKIGLTDAELGVNILMRKKDVFDYDVRGKRGREKIFPFAVKRNRDDEYGDVIRPEDYLRAEERDEDAIDETVKPEDEAVVGQKRKWDDGATSRPGDRNQQRGAMKRRRLSNGQKLDSSGEPLSIGAPNEAEDDSEDESDDGVEDTVPAGPRKMVYSEKEVRLDINICFVDFCGLAERRDLQMLIPLIKPSKLLITGGSALETASLAADCRSALQQDGPDAQIIFTPLTGETVDASVESNAWSIKLSRALIKRLAWQSVKGLSVVAVTAQLGMGHAELDDNNAADEQRRKKLRMIKGSPEPESKDVIKSDEAAGEAVLDIVPTTSAIAAQQTTQPIHVGDLRLADLRRLMQSTGHVAEFRGEGTLLIDGTVIVRKTAGGKIAVEGGAYVAPGTRYDPNASFVDVRTKIYEGLAVVAGG